MAPWGLITLVFYIILFGVTAGVIPQTVLALRGSYGVAKAWAMTPPWLRSRLPRSSDTVNFPSTLMSPSKTHSKINILRELLHFS